VACEIVLALQTMVTRRFYAFDPIVVTAGRIAAGTKNNIIGDDAVIELTVRTFSAHARERALTEIEKVAQGVSSAHSMGVDLEREMGYPATVNDPDEHRFAVSVIEDLFGPQRWVDQAFPEAGSEDMSFVLEQVPGAYVNISACPRTADPASAPDNHSPRAEFDDAVLADIVAFFTEVALRRCAPAPDAR